MLNTMEDRYKVVATFPNGKMVTIMSEREIKAFCKRNECKVQTENGLIDVSEFKFGYRIRPITRFGAVIETPDINLVTT